MAVDAISEFKKENPILLKQRLANAERLEKQEANGKQEILVFARKAEASQIVAKATATAKPVQEHVSAVASSLHTTPLFEYANKAQNEYKANQALFNFENSVASTKLTKPSGSNSSGDKKDEGNQFASAHKGINEIRLEKLMEGDIESIDIA